MIIDLLNKLIGRLIELQNVRKKGRREILDVYIDPLFQEFETIHKLYVDSFRNYRKALSEPKCSVEQLLEKVQEERLFSQAQRSKLMHLVNATRDSSDDDDLKSFCTQIHSYLVFTHDDDQSFEGGSVQRWYHAFVRLVGSIDGGPLPSHSYLEPPWNYAKSVSANLEI